MTIIVLRLLRINVADGMEMGSDAKKCGSHDNVSKRWRWSRFSLLAFTKFKCRQLLMVCFIDLTLLVENVII